VGKRRDHGERHFVATLDDERAVVDVRFHLVDDHLGNGIPALQRVAHSHRALRGSVAQNRHAEMERDATLLPDCKRRPRRRFWIDDVGGMIGRSANDGDARRVLLEAIVNRFERPIWLAVVSDFLPRPIEDGGDGDRFVRFALDVKGIRIGRAQHPQLRRVSHLGASPS